MNGRRDFDGIVLGSVHLDGDARTIEVGIFSGLCVLVVLLDGCLKVCRINAGSLCKLGERIAFLGKSEFERRPCLLDLVTDLLVEDFEGRAAGLLADGRTRYVARGQLTDEALAFAVDEDGTGASNSFRNDDGRTVWLCLEEGVKKQGNKIKVVWEAPACELLKNAKGEIVGAAAVKGGKKFYVRAKKAVVLCTGGYEYSRAMRSAFLEGPGINGWAFYGTTSNTGDGISMGMAVGAGLQKAGKSAARVIVPTQKRFNGMRLGSITPAVGSTNSIVVDNFGKRYEAETKVTDNPSRYFFYKAAVQFDISTLSYPRTPSWMIFDEKLRASKPLVGLGISVVGYGMVDWDKDNLKAIESGLILKADTIEELAEKIRNHPENKHRMVPANLVETVERFNKFCDEKKDEDFGRRPATLGKIAQGPFYAMPLVAGGPNTKGGLLANADREVLTWEGKPIPHLYCVGEIASALKFVYQGGGNLTECLVYGRHCGKIVAKLPDTAV